MAWSWPQIKRVAINRAALPALALWLWVVPAVAESLPRERFDAGVERLRARLEDLARTAKGVHGNEHYLVEVVTRPTGAYIAVTIRALTNDPQTFAVCQSARRHFLRRLTGAGAGAALPAAVARTFDGLFFPESGASDRRPSPAAADLAAKTSLTMVLSWRKCSGWIAGWDALE